MLHAAMTALPRGHEAAPALPRPSLGEHRAELFDEAAARRPAVRALIACVLGRPVDHPDVEDCAHEALARAFEGRGRLRDGEPLRPWSPSSESPAGPLAGCGSPSSWYGADCVTRLRICAGEGSASCCDPPAARAMTLAGA